MHVSPAAFEVLRALLGVLPRFGDWYLFGAQAVIAYGVPRLSADVDVTLRLVPDVPDRLVGDMRAAGFEPRVPDADFVRRTRVLPFVHASTGMPLDVVLFNQVYHPHKKGKARQDNRPLDKGVFQRKQGAKGKKVTGKD